MTATCAPLFVRVAEGPHTNHPHAQLNWSALTMIDPFDGVVNQFAALLWSVYEYLCVCSFCYINHDCEHSALL